MRNRASIFSILAFLSSMAASSSHAEICEKLVDETLARYKFGSFDHPASGVTKDKDSGRTTFRYDELSGRNRPNHYVMIEEIKGDSRVDHVIANQSSNKHSTSMLHQVRMKGCRLVEVIYGDNGTPSNLKLRVTAETCSKDLASADIQNAAKALLDDPSSNPTDWQSRNPGKTKTLHQALNRHSTVPEGLIKRALLVCGHFKDYLSASARSNPVFQTPAKESGVSGTTH